MILEAQASLATVAGVVGTVVAPLIGVVVWGFKRMVGAAEAVPGAVAAAIKEAGEENRRLMREAGEEQRRLSDAQEARHAEERRELREQLQRVTDQLIEASKACNVPAADARH